MNEVTLYGEITDSQAQALCDQLLEAHDETTANQPILLFIASTGGDESGARSIASTIGRIRRDGRKVIGHVIADAHSGAFYVLQHCDSRLAEPLATLMLHHTKLTMEEGSTAQQLAAHSADIRKMEIIWLRTIAARTGKDVPYYLAKIASQDWYLTAQEALAEGLLDEIITVPPLPVSKTALPPARKRVKK